MALADYELLAARSFEEPHDADLRASVLVCADALSQEGDPRGPLIAMEHALRDADHKRAVLLRKAMHEHAATEASALLGSASGLMQTGRTLALDWRSGKLYGMSIDARYLPGKSKISAGDLVKQAIGAPAAADLRRLRVRVRSTEDTRTIVEMFGRHGKPPPLEELSVQRSAWPLRMDQTPTTWLLDRLPNLYYAVRDDQLLALAPRGVYRDPERYVPELEGCDPPTEPKARAFLGRCLTNHNRELRLAALARIKQLGRMAKVYEQALCTMLQPGIATVHEAVSSAPLLPIVEALVAVRPSRGTRRMLDRIASRPEYYDAAVRSVAGKATELDRR